MTKEVRIYTTEHCPHCKRAKDLLARKNIVFHEIDITDDAETREKISQKTGWMTVPMIFIGDDFIGGADDLYALEERGELDSNLK